MEDGSLDESFPVLEFNRELRIVHVYDDRSMLITGLFNQINGESSPSAVRLDKNGQTLTDVIVPNFQNELLNELVNGDFILNTRLSYGDHIRTHIKKTDSDGNVDESFKSDHEFRGMVLNNNLSRGYINTMAALPDGSILIGGDFDEVNGQVMPCLIAIDSNGDILEDFDAGFKAGECRVSDILYLHENQIMVAGNFTSYRELDYSGVIQIRSDGSLVPSFKTPDDLNDVRRLGLYSDDRIVISGSFDFIDGKLQRGVARVIINAVSTSLQSEDEFIPSRYVLEPNFPNPFNPTTTLRVELPESAEVSVTVYDPTGRMVMQLPMRSLQAGRHNITLDAARLGSGVYVYRVSTGSWMSSGKMTLVK